MWRDPNQLSVYGKEHSETQDRWTTIGIDSGGVLHTVVHTFEPMDEELCEIRMISERRATGRETEWY